MIDIHTRIIPNLDDGPPDMGTSVGIGRIAAQEGVTAMISTSHSEECTAVGYEGIKERLESVRTAWEEAGINIRLETGDEISWFRIRSTRSKRASYGRSLEALMCL